MKDLLYEPAGLFVRAELLPQRCGEKRAVLNFLVAARPERNQPYAGRLGLTGGCRLSETGKIAIPADREE